MASYDNVDEYRIPSRNGTHVESCLLGFIHTQSKKRLCVSVVETDVVTIDSGRTGTAPKMVRAGRRFGGRRSYQS